MSARLSFVLVSFLAACGGDDGDKPIDAPPVTPSIVLVDPCPATPDLTITTLATAFDMPASTITQGKVVKFVSTATHPIKAQAGTDPALAVPEGQTKCFRFTMAGTFKFQCTVHGYAGTITVN
jgi:hypothetical protein